MICVSGIFFSILYRPIETRKEIKTFWRIPGCYRWISLHDVQLSKNSAYVLLILGHPGDVLEGFEACLMLLQSLGITDWNDLECLFSVLTIQPIIGVLNVDPYPKDLNVKKNRMTWYHYHKHNHYWLVVWNIIFHNIWDSPSIDELICFKMVIAPPTRLLLTIINHIKTIIINHY